MSEFSCRWVHDKEIGRFLVPGCWNRVHGGDDADCHCSDRNGEKSIRDELDDIRARLNNLENGAVK